MRAAGNPGWRECGTAGTRAAGNASGREYGPGRVEQRASAVARRVRIRGTSFANRSGERGRHETWLERRPARGVLGRAAVPRRRQVSARSGTPLAGGRPAEGAGAHPGGGGRPTNVVPRWNSDGGRPTDVVPAPEQVRSAPTAAPSASAAPRRRRAPVAGVGRSRGGERRKEVRSARSPDAGGRRGQFQRWNTRPTRPTDEVPGSPPAHGLFGGYTLDRARALDAPCPTWARATRAGGTRASGSTCSSSRPSRRSGTPCSRSTPAASSRPRSTPDPPAHGAREGRHRDVPAPPARVEAESRGLRARPRCSTARAAAAELRGARRLGVNFDAAPGSSSSSPKFVPGPWPYDLRRNEG